MGIAAAVAVLDPLPGMSRALACAFDTKIAIVALQAGIASVAQRADDPDRIVHVVLAALNGEAIVPRSFLYNLAARSRAEAEIDLTDSEVSWLRRLAAGTTTHDLATELEYSERAMFRVLHDLYSRLGVANRQQAWSASSTAAAQS